MLPSITLFQCWQRLGTGFTTAPWTQIYHGYICLNCNWTVNMLSACHVSQRHCNVWSPLGSTRLVAGLQLEGAARICPHVTFCLLVWRSHYSDTGKNLLVKSMWPLQHHYVTGVQQLQHYEWVSVTPRKITLTILLITLITAKFKCITHNSWYFYQSVTCAACTNTQNFSRNPHIVFCQISYFIT